MNKELKTEATFPEVVGESRRGNVLYARNPFMQEISIQVSERKTTISKGSIVVSSRGEKIGDACIAQIVPVDKEKFVKLYVQNIAAIFELNKSGIRMLGVLLHIVQEYPQQDQVFMSHPEAAKAHAQLNDKPLSRTTFDRGISELIEHQVIAESPKGLGWFYINPNLVFNGNRVTFINSYVREEAYQDEVEKLKYLTKSAKTGQFLLPITGGQEEDE